MNSSFIAFALLNIGFVLLVSPLFMSLIKKVKAWAQGRRGPSLFQTYYNIAKLLRKETVYSPVSSWVMRVTPYVCLSMTVVAALFVPILYVPEPVAGFGNVILFLYLLGLARFFMALSGLDAGSTFGGMSSSRDMSLAAVIEPTSIVVMAALAVVAGSLNFLEIARDAAGMLFPASATMFLIGVSLFIILIVETGRIPVDNPETHLELTMVHEGMVLEQSGRNLAMMEYAGAVKQTLFIAILVSVLMPFGLVTELSVTGVLFAMVLFVVKGSVVSVIVGLLESSIAKMRLFSLPNLFIIAYFFSVFTIFTEVFA
ncbi:respiratory chain complex I subunit 1 family protein [Methanoculleus bourgensis]|uniref:respiratory chain complex I subunit 1 family protein n=1 Tax=Methanoculleus bourgensis TaxID=83986 RepID=UPI0022EF91D1|nr:NADH-quinone oxidoreductase subunit H [Methanoculleus bourgensis]GLI46739.1 hydrogenase [Methanoculleus bourgensis]